MNQNFNSSSTTISPIFKKLQSFTLLTSPFGQFRAEITTINNRPYVTLCKYFQPPLSTDWYPSGRVVNLPPTAWQNLLEIIPILNNAIAGTF